MKKFLFTLLMFVVGCSAFAQNQSGVEENTLSYVSKPVYQGGWVFGIKNNFEFADKYSNANMYMNIFDLSTSYQGLVPLNDKVSFSFLFGGGTSYSSNEYFKISNKGSGVIDNESWTFNLNFGLGFDFKISEKTAIGFIYEPLIWRNYIRFDNYPLYYDVGAYIDFGEILSNSRSAFRLELGWSGFYNNWEMDFLGGLYIGAKVTLFGDSKSARNKSALMVNTVVATLPFIVQYIKSSNNSSYNNPPEYIDCDECSLNKKRDRSRGSKLIDGETYYYYECPLNHSAWYCFN